MLSPLRTVLRALPLAAVGGALCTGLVAAFAQDGGPRSDLDFAASVQQERERIASERATLESGFDAEDRACRERFFVNRCLQELAPRRREALSRLRQQELQIEEAERARRQEAALARTAQKQADAQRPPEESPEQAAARQQREQALREREQAERGAQARERVQRQHEREREAAERQRARQDADRARARRSDLQSPPEPDRAAPAAPSL